MRSRRYPTMVLLALLTLVPASAAAQEAPAEPSASEPVPVAETVLVATEWRLIEQRVGDVLEPVPVTIPASLRLADGAAVGNTGCNEFSASYTLDGTALSFGPEVTRSLRACDPDAQSVEDAYLAALGEVASWSIIYAALELRDELGQPVLVFEQPNAALTPTQLSRLLARISVAEATIAQLESRIDAIGIGRLRDRISELESANQRLGQQLARPDVTARPDRSTAFSPAELVVLEGIPARIAASCQPLRQRLPTGTAAAVQCQPDTARVTEMAYYLLEGPRAVKLFEDRMRAGGATPLETYGPPGTPSCADGAATYVYADGGGIGGLGCFVDGGRANLRLVQDATECRQLRVGNRQLKRPAMYAALTGASRDIVPLYDWTVGGRGIIGKIDRPRAKKSPGVGCP